MACNVYGALHLRSFRPISFLQKQTLGEYCTVRCALNRWTIPWPMHKTNNFVKYEGAPIEKPR